MHKSDARWPRKKAATADSHGATTPNDSMRETFEVEDGDAFNDAAMTESTAINCNNIEMYSGDEAAMASPIMNTASKLGPHTQTDRGTCPGVGL